MDNTYTEPQIEIIEGIEDVVSTSLGTESYETEIL